jgi:hypothetical protein
MKAKLEMLTLQMEQRKADGFNSSTDSLVDELNVADKFALFSIAESLESITSLLDELVDVTARSNEVKR